jgi:hypothetical protein
VASSAVACTCFSSVSLVGMDAAARESSDMGTWWLDTSELSAPPTCSLSVIASDGLA